MEVAHSKERQISCFSEERLDNFEKKSIFLKLR